MGMIADLRDLLLPSALCIRDELVGDSPHGVDVEIDADFEHEEIILRARPVGRGNVWICHALLAGDEVRTLRGIPLYDRLRAMTSDLVDRALRAHIAHG